MAQIELMNVSKRWGNFIGVDNFNLTIVDEEFLVLLGPSGCGKTTMMRMIAGLEEASEGDIVIDGKVVNDLEPKDRDVAMVFQQYSLYPHLTVQQNLEFPLKSPILKTPADEMKRQVSEVAEVLQISHKLDNKATDLSGGEMQRVSIGRALVRNPSVFLMDEPLSSLDAKLRSDLRIELKSIQANSGATLLYVTHDQIEAMTMATHIGVLDQGKLVQFGAPRDIYENPVSVYAASRLGQPRINVLPADVFGGAPDGQGVCGRCGRVPNRLQKGDHDGQWPGDPRGRQDLPQWNHGRGADERLEDVSIRRAAPPLWPRPKEGQRHCTRLREAHVLGRRLPHPWRSDQRRPARPV